MINIYNYFLFKLRFFIFGLSKNTFKFLPNKAEALKPPSYMNLIAQINIWEYKYDHNKIDTDDQGCKDPKRDYGHNGTDASC